MHVEVLVLTDLESKEKIEIDITGSDLEKIADQLKNVPRENGKWVFNKTGIHLFGVATHKNYKPHEL